jgi:ubiquinone/menaquinone biosynthesis C-methylase UbiE
VLFDGVARLYDEARVGYPMELVHELVTRAGLDRDTPVLEVGCGTGQLTVDLAGRGLSVTAIDIGPAMAAATREKVAGMDVAVHATSFEDFTGPDRGFGAVVSATAFHWIDPEVAWTKSARLLRPGGWLAILGTAERYDDPLGGDLREQWIRYSDDGGAWASAPQPTLVDRIASSGHFDDAIASTHRERRTMPADAVMAVEQTRATILDYDDQTRERFLADLSELLAGRSDVSLTQETTLTMAQVRAR